MWVVFFRKCMLIYFFTLQVIKTKEMDKNKLFTIKRFYQ